MSTNTNTNGQNQTPNLPQELSWDYIGSLSKEQYAALTPHERALLGQWVATPGTRHKPIYEQPEEGSALPNPLTWEAAKAIMQQGYQQLSEQDRARLVTWMVENRRGR